MMPVIFQKNIKPVKFEFSSLHDFLNNEFIRYFTKDPLFCEFVLCRSYAENELIVKRLDGKHYKIGLIDGDIKEIPEWCGQKNTYCAKSL